MKINQKSVEIRDPQLKELFAEEMEALVGGWKTYDTPNGPITVPTVPSYTNPANPAKPNPHY